MLLKANILNAEVTKELDDGLGWTGIWEWPWPGADPCFVGPEAYTIFRALFKKENKKLGTNVNIYLEREKLLKLQFKKTDEYHKLNKIQKMT
jgi:hypothetical protein